MKILEVLELIRDKLPGADLEQLAREVEKKRDGYSVLAISFEAGKLNEVADFLSQFKADDDYILDMGGNLAAYLLKNKSMNEYRSAADFAQNLKTALEQENNLKIQVGIGGDTDTLSALGESVTALKYGGFISDKKGIFSYKEYLLLKTLEDIPERKMAEYAPILFDPKTRAILDDEDMTDTAEEFLNSSLNISETSRKLYMHRNSLLYRLDKIQEETGLDIREFADAWIFKTIAVLYRIQK
ncbi:MAG: helix-turn-helix domain-containing protein [Clostridiales bacterium]|jgi:carbohydrate diacid regulator|nr:helix-turn-helix domain-containing protein [Clostridiales bacterium]